MSNKLTNTRSEKKETICPEMGIRPRRLRLTRLVTLLALCCSAVVSSAFDGFTFQDVEGPDDLSPAMRHTEHEVSPAMLEVEEGAPTYPRVNQHAPGEPMAFECGRRHSVAVGRIEVAVRACHRVLRGRLGDNSRRMRAACRRYECPNGALFRGRCLLGAACGPGTLR